MFSWLLTRAGMRHAAACLLVCLSYIAVLEAQEKMPTKITSIEGITEFRLDNGCQVLLFPDSSQPVVTVNMTVFVGSRHEGYGESGMAHLLEHMLFKGTPAHPNVPKALQDRGARFNGSTWLDRTNYFETLPADSDNLEFAIRLEADRLVNSHVRGEDLTSEMTVVRSEFEQGENSPMRVLQQRVTTTAYQWHNYGKSTIGNRSDIERVPITNLRNFYRKFYRPDNVMVVIAGKFDPTAAIQLVNKYFGILASPTVPLDPTYTVEPAQDGERTTVVRRVGKAQYMVAAYHIPSGGDPTYPAVDILSTILSDEPSGKLYKNLVQTQKAASVFGGSYAVHDPGIMIFGGEVPMDKSLEEARLTMLSTLEDIAKDPITEVEVQRAKVQILKARELRATKSAEIAVELSEWAAQGDWRLYFLFRDRIEKVTQADVQAAALKYLVRNNRTVGLFIPTEGAERISIPERGNLKEMLAEYKGRSDVSAGEEFDPAALAVEKRTDRGQLKSGVQYAFLPKKTRGESVNLSLSLRFGDEKSMFGQVAACDMLGELMSRGTQSMDYQTIKDKLDELRASMNVSTRPGVLQLRVVAKRDTLKQVLDIVHEVLRKPTLPASEFDIIKLEQITTLETQLAEPNSLAPTAVTSALAPYPRGDVRYVSTPLEDIEDLKKLTRENVQNFYSQFLNGKVGEVACVGDFDVSQVKSQLEGILNDWNSPVTYARVPTPAAIQVPGSIKSIEAPDKANSLYYASQHIKLRDDNPKYPALMMGNYILGVGGLSSRLGDRVRQKEGLSYGVSSGLNAHPIDERTTFTVFAITNPANRDKLIKTIEEELQRLINDGVTQEELDKAKQGFLQSQTVSRSSDGTLTAQLVNTLFARRTMQFSHNLEQKIATLTVDEVNAAFKEFVQPSKLVIATAGDFAGVEKSAVPVTK